jgi:hypothetical protein
MLELWAIFEDDLEEAVPVEMIGNGQAELDRVDGIWETGEWDGRKLHAMWVIDANSELGDVIRIYGAVPTAIADRYQEYLERRGDIDG